MSRSLLVLTLLALANLLAFAVAEAAPSGRLAPEPVVAVLDTGVSIADGSVLPGVDLVERGTAPADENGHGSAVAATISAACGGCRILPVRVLSAAGTAPWARVAAGIVWAVDHGASVVNVSIAGTGGSRALRRAVEHARSHGVRVVAAAGNTGGGEPQYPAAYPGVVAVAAVDAAGGLATWSSRGAWVDEVAPGCEQLARPTGRRVWACGTSFAAPLVSARLAADALPEPVQAVVALRVAGRPRVGSTLRATLTHGAAPVRWYRCAPEAAPHDCVAVSRAATYTVGAADTGAELEARALTTSFGGLWLAASSRLAVG